VDHSFINTLEKLAKKKNKSQRELAHFSFKTTGNMRIFLNFRFQKNLLVRRKINNISFSRFVVGPSLNMATLQCLLILLILLIKLINFRFFQTDQFEK
jgi:hypothetical protein